LVGRTREQIGNDVELMLDSWMWMNVEYVVRLVEVLKPYRLKKRDSACRTKFWLRVNIGTLSIHLRWLLRKL